MKISLVSLAAALTLLLSASLTTAADLDSCPNLEGWTSFGELQHDEWRPDDEGTPSLVIGGRTISLSRMFVPPEYEYPDGWRRAFDDEDQLAKLSRRIYLVAEELSLEFRLNLDLKGFYRVRQLLPQGNAVVDVVVARTCDDTTIHILGFNRHGRFFGDEICFPTAPWSSCVRFGLPVIFLPGPVYVIPYDEVDN